MRKLLSILTAAALISNATVAETIPSSQLLDDSASFVIAKSVKLGLGEDDTHFAPAIGGQRKVEADKHAVTKCEKDADCADDQYCTMGMCKDLCARNTTKKKVKCSGETPVCTVDNHDSYCACNDESCGAALSCKKVGSRYSCEPCGAGEKCGCPDGKMSNGAGKCVTCNFDADCADNEVCSNPKTEAAACTVLTCPTGQYVANHKCNSCAEAITGCQACTSKTNCTTCHVKYQNPANNGGQCVLKTCPAAQYLNEEDGNCYPCSNGCTKCTGPSNCQSCQAAYNLVSGAYCELKTCPQGTYLSMSDGQCYACPSTCSACSTVMNTGETSACTACVNDYKLSGTQCVLKSCSEMGYTTSCGGDYNAIPANKSGSDGTCYSCQQKSCGEMGYSTSCGGDYNANATGKSGRDGTCYSCSQKSCSQMGYRTSCSGNENATYVKSGSDGSCYSCSTKSCSQMGYRTSCSSNENATYKTSGSDGSCYSCSLKSCSAINSSYRTSCGSGYTATSTGVSGSDGACVTCSAISGYCTSDSQCGSTQRCSNNRCVAVSCDTCYYASNHTCARNSSCCLNNNDCGSSQKCVNNSCVKKSCGEMGYKSSCNTADGYTAVSANVTGSDGTCYNCNVASCPSGYSTSTTSCSKGYALKTNGKSGGKACGKCEEAGCSAYGYYSSCPAGKVLAGSNIGNCYARCDDVKCPSGYQKTQPSCSGAGYELLTETVSGVTCYKCGDKPCPNGYATFIQGHRVDEAFCQGSNYETNGYSGAYACGKCVSRPGSSSSARVCTTHSDCSRGYECTGDACRKCRAGSNLSSGYENCNCSVGTWSDGYGGCSTNVCPGGRAKQYNSRTNSYECPW